MSSKVVKGGKFYIKNGEFSDLWEGVWVDETKRKVFGVSAKDFDVKG